MPLTTTVSISPALCAAMAAVIVLAATLLGLGAAGQACEQGQQGGGTEQPVGIVGHGENPSHFKMATGQSNSVGRCSHIFAKAPVLLTETAGPVFVTAMTRVVDGPVTVTIRKINLDGSGCGMSSPREIHVTLA